MAGEKDLKQLTIADPPGIIIDLDGFHVIADATVCRLRRGAARIPHTCSYNALYTPEPGVRSPESPQGKGCRLLIFRRLSVKRQKSGI